MVRIWAASILFCAAAIAAGSWLVREAGRSQSQVERVASWHRTTGALDEIRIFYLPLLRSQTSYAAEAFYRFEVDGRRYTGKGMFDRSTAATVEALKDRLKTWLNDPYARVSETPSSVGIVYVYTPFAETVPVYYDPVDPATSFFGNPSSDRPDLGGMRIVGWGVLTFGVTVLGVVLGTALSTDPGAERHARLRARAQAEATAGLTAPTDDDVLEFAGLLDAAIASIDGAIRDDRAYGRLNGALASLRQLRRNPGHGLLREAHLGFGRWLSGEWDVENWGPPGARIMAAVDAVEAFHQRWRAAARTRLAPRLSL